MKIFYDNPDGTGYKHSRVEEMCCENIGRLYDHPDILVDASTIWVRNGAGAFDRRIILMYCPFCGEEIEHVVLGD